MARGVRVLPGPFKLNIVGQLSADTNKQRVDPSPVVRLGNPRKGASAKRVRRRTPGSGKISGSTYLERL